MTTSAHRRFGPFPTLEVVAKSGLQQEEADCKHRAKCAVYVLSRGFSVRNPAASCLMKTWMAKENVKNYVSFSHLRVQMKTPRGSRVRIPSGVQNLGGKSVRHCAP